MTNVGVIQKCHYTLLYVSCELRNSELHVLYVSSNVNLGNQIKGEERRQICGTQSGEQQFIRELVSKPKKTSDTSSLTAGQHLNAP